ncbi:radical SAM protein [Kitasatospora sp. NPDC058032]|uniref:radical SAM protein n=1 Tax=Kitasatospora sp. NPDC058032 TaxID=3346307 RepID=UPI0036D79BE8
MTAVLEPPTDAIPKVPSMIELEITGKCQLACSHCFADSGPTGTHGVMSVSDWYDVIDQAADLDIRTVQLIGGEPTTYPGWADLVDHALSRGRLVEVFSNLYHVTAKGWSVFERDGVSLATSYYSPNSGEHDKVTTVKGSQERTRANIVEAVRRGIRIRAGIVGVHDGQLEQLAVEELRALGVGQVTLDYARGVGRAAKVTPDVGTLCGNCGRGRLAIMPDGAVSPCVLGRWIRPFNVRETSLREILVSSEWAAAVDSIPARAPGDHSDGLGVVGMCPPSDSNDCNPAKTPACNPKYEFAPAALRSCPPNDSNDCAPTEAPCNPAFGL